jgi:hypothetical protein
MEKVMRKNNRIKLVLGKQTLRNLQLVQVQGAVAPVTPIYRTQDVTCSCAQGCNVE